ELVLRLASLLWRLRRVNANENGLFEIQARHLLQVRQERHPHRNRQNIIHSMHQNAAATEEDKQRTEDEPPTGLEVGSRASVDPADQSDDLTRAFVRLSNLPTYPLDRLSRYEARLWRQTCQVLLTLQCLRRRKPWESFRLR